MATKNEVASTNNGALMIVEELKNNMGLQYKTNVLVSQIKNLIHAPQGMNITDEDVVSVMMKAKSMNLDPFKSGVYAFKGKDGLVVGVSKSGFQQAMSSQPSFNSLTYKRSELKRKKVADKNGVKEISFYDSVTAVIIKIDSKGNLGQVEGTAYFDEEFNGRSSSWLKMPKRMLENRAMCIACANAFGWGAYSDDEVREIATNYNAPVDVPHEVVTGATRAQTAVEAQVKQLEAVAEAEVLPPIDLKEIKSSLEASVSYDELKSKFKTLAPDLRKNEELLAFCRELKQKLTAEEDL